MSEYVDVDIIENGKKIGSFKCLHKTEEKAAIDQKADEYAYNEWRDFPEEQAIARRGFKAGAEYVLKLYESTSEKEKCELLGIIQAKDARIAELETTIKLGNEREAQDIRARFPC